MVFEKFHQYIGSIVYFIYIHINTAFGYIISQLPDYYNKNLVKLILCEIVCV